MLLKESINIDLNLCFIYLVIMFEKIDIMEKFNQSEHIVVYPGDCIDLLKTIPDKSVELIERFVLSMTNEEDWVLDHSYLVMNLQTNE